MRDVPRQSMSFSNWELVPRPSSTSPAAGGPFLYSTAERRGPAFGRKTQAIQGSITSRFGSVRRRSGGS